MTDIEKNVLQPQRRLRKSKVFFLSLSLFLGALIIMFFEFRSLINTSAPTWHAAPNVPISAPKNASSNRIEKGTPLPSNLSNQSAESQGVLYEPTDALRKLADKLHLPLPAKSRLRPSPSNLKPTHTDKILLLLEAAKNKLYEFPSDVDKRISELQPDTMEKFAQSLRKVIPNTDDVQMFISSHTSWTTKHRQDSPLTVFSKSYCPYSRKAKTLLTKLGVKFEVHEVDLRKDAKAVQEALRELTGHRTFPAIFLHEQLIGGSDDLDRLYTTGALTGILEAGHVQKNHA